MIASTRASWGELNEFLLKDNETSSAMAFLDGRRESTSKVDDEDEEGDDLNLNYLNHD
jgi:hypothetical protein